MCNTQCSITGNLDSMRPLLPWDLLAVVLFILVKPLGPQQNGHGEERTYREACGRWQESSPSPSGTHFPCILSLYPWSDSPWILWNTLVPLNLHVCQQAFNVFKTWMMFKGRYNSSEIGLLKALSCSFSSG